MGLINWVFDFYQHYRIDQIQKETNQARVEAAMRSPSGGVDSEKLETAIGAAETHLVAAEKIHRINWTVPHQIYSIG